jgi:hypothetical protein
MASPEVAAADAADAVPGEVLIAIVIDDHLAIGFPFALLDHCCIAVARLVLLDYGCSFAIPVAVDVAMIRAYCHSRSGGANSDTDANFLGACGHCGAYACRCYNHHYVFHEPFLSFLKPAPTP